MPTPNDDVALKMLMVKRRMILTMAKTKKIVSMRSSALMRSSSEDFVSYLISLFFFFNLLSTAGYRTFESLHYDNRSIDSSVHCVYIKIPFLVVVDYYSCLFHIEIEE